MNETIIEAINRRIDEHHAYLCERLNDLREQASAAQAAVLARLDAHEAYHQRQEHRFGLMRLAERHPLRLALAAFALGGTLLASAPPSLHWLARWMAEFLRRGLANGG